MPSTKRRRSERQSEQAEQAAESEEQEHEPEPSTKRKKKTTNFSGDADGPHFGGPVPTEMLDAFAEWEGGGVNPSTLKHYGDNLRLLFTEGEGDFDVPAGWTLEQAVEALRGQPLDKRGFFRASVSKLILFLADTEGRKPVPVPVEEEEEEEEEKEAAAADNPSPSPRPAPSPPIAVQYREQGGHVYRRLGPGSSWEKQPPGFVIPDARTPAIARASAGSPSEAAAASATSHPEEEDAIWLQPDDPLKPKRPQTAYFCFCSSRRAALLEERPELTKDVKDVARALGQEWQALDSDARQPFAEQAAAEKTRYDQEMAVYVPPDKVLVLNPTKRQREKAAKQNGGRQRASPPQPGGTAPTPPSMPPPGAECPLCAPGSGKLQGHKGRHVGGSKSQQCGTPRKTVPAAVRAAVERMVKQLAQEEEGGPAAAAAAAPSEKEWRRLERAWVWSDQQGEYVPKVAAT